VSRRGGGRDDGRGARCVPNWRRGRRWPRRSVARDARDEAGDDDAPTRGHDEPPPRRRQRFHDAAFVAGAAKTTRATPTSNARDVLVVGLGDVATTDHVPDAASASTRRRSAAQRRGRRERRGRGGRGWLGERGFDDSPAPDAASAPTRRRRRRAAKSTKAVRARWATMARCPRRIDGAPDRRLQRFHDAAEAPGRGGHGGR
jgi:hypothetical protein